MEAIAVIGGASAVLSIAMEFGKMGERLYRLVKTLRYAQKEVQDISKEVSNFSKILRILDETLDSAQSTELIIGQESTQAQLIQELMDQSCPLLKEFKRLRVKLKPLREGQSTDAISRAIARFQWWRNKNSTIYLRRLLDSHKITLNLLIVTILLGEKVAEYKRCEQKGESVSEKLRMTIKALRRELRREKEECRRVKAEVEDLRYQQPGAVETPASAEHFMRTVLKLATQQQEIDRRHSKKRGSIVSSSESGSPEQRNLLSSSTVHGSNLGHFGGDIEVEVEIISIAHQSSSPSAAQESGSPSATEESSSPSATRESGSPSATEESSSPSATRESSPPSATEELGSPSATREPDSPSATRGSSPPATTQRRRLANSVPTALFGPPIVGPVVYDDGNQIRVLDRQWRTRRSSRESISGSGGYGSSVSDGENDV